jgi:hypothetical protein
MLGKGSRTVSCDLHLGDSRLQCAMCHAGLVNNSLVTDYDIGVLPSEYQDYLKSMVGVQHDKTLK